MNKRISFLVLGGDARQQYLLSLLRSQGFPCQDGIKGDLLEPSSLSRYIQEADVVCGPIPFSANGCVKGCSLPLGGPKQGASTSQTSLKQGASTSRTSLKQGASTSLAGQLHAGQYLLGGGLPGPFVEALALQGVKAFDYLTDETLTSYNTIATAEGILADIITSYPDNLCETPVLVLGYGRCAIALAHRLRLLGACTTVCARKEAALGQAESLGHKTLPLAELPQKASQYPLIVNTIPALVLEKSILATLPADTRLYDIASAPGGIDLEAAKALGLCATLHPGLPGRYAPRASARAMYQYILRVLPLELL